MAKKNGAVGRSAQSGRFITVNRDYVKKQASEAVTTFFAPLSGAWGAAKDAGEPQKEKLGRPSR